MSMINLAKGLDALADSHARVRGVLDDAFAAVESAHAHGGKQAFAAALTDLRAAVDITHSLVEASHQTAKAMADIVPAFSSVSGEGDAAPSSTRSIRGPSRATRTSVPEGA